MKATGIVRRIDELGRVVIPKEIRRTQRIRQGDALEIYTAADGEVVFKKYSPLIGLEQLAAVYAEVLAKSMGNPVMVCDRENIVAATGQGRAELLGRAVGAEVEALLAARVQYLAPNEPSRRARLFDRGERRLLCASPIIAHGDIEGGVLLVGSERDTPPNSETAHAIATAASFLARWLEE
ncbi:MAG: stage V sporulation T C-terminal domain-containing protein [Gemmiger sp.]